MRRLGTALSLVGYDDFELAEMLDPPVTVINQDPTAMGQKAAWQLFARLLGDESPPATVVMPTRLVVRGSRRLVPKTAAGPAGTSLSFVGSAGAPARVRTTAGKGPV